AAVDVVRGVRLRPHGCGPALLVPLDRDSRLVDLDLDAFRLRFLAPDIDAERDDGDDQDGDDGVELVLLHSGPPRLLPRSTPQSAPGQACAQRSLSCQRGLIHGSRLEGGSGARPRMWSATFSPTMIEGALRLPLVIRGKTEESATRRPSTPITRHSGSTTAIRSSARPMRHVPHG